MMTTTSSRPPRPVPTGARTDAPACYEIEDLGELAPDVPLLPVAMNDDNNVVLFSWPAPGTCEAGRTRGFLRQEGQLIPAGVTTGSPPVSGLSDSGLLCGQGRLRSGGRHAWATHLGLFGLDFWPSEDSHATAVNREGWVTGYVTEVVCRQKTERAFLVAPDGRWQTFAPPQTISAQAAALNDRGDVVLNARPRSTADYESVAWLRRNECYERLPDLGGATWATAITPAGAVVGRATLPDGRVHAVLWRDGKVFDLNADPMCDSEALSANDVGVVVGRCLWHGRGRAAFRWTAVEGLRPLAEFVPGLRGCTLESTVAVNASGLIAAVGRRNGQHRGFILHPR